VGEASWAWDIEKEEVSKNGDGIPYMTLCRILIGLMHHSVLPRKHWNV
jgi:hypothetical protein